MTEIKACTWTVTRLLLKSWQENEIKDCLYLCDICTSTLTFFLTYGTLVDKISSGMLYIYIFRWKSCYLSWESLLSVSYRYKYVSDFYNFIDTLHSLKIDVHVHQCTAYFILHVIWECRWSKQYMRRLNVFDNHLTFLVVYQ